MTKTRTITVTFKAIDAPPNKPVRCSICTRSISGPHVRVIVGKGSLPAHARCIPQARRDQSPLLDALCKGIEAKR